MALTGGTCSITASCSVSGVTKAPQGTATVAGVPSPTWSGSNGDTEVLAFGTASGLADIYCYAAFSIALSSSSTFDLFTGSDFKNVMGDTAAFAKLKSIYVQVVDGTGGTAGVTIGGAASNANALWFGNQNDTWTIFDGGPPFIGGNPAGVTVDATHCNLKISNNSSSAAVTVIIALAGSSV